MSKKSSKSSENPPKKSSKQESGPNNSESLSNLSAIIALEKCEKKKRLHKLVMERIKGLKKRP